MSSEEKTVFVGLSGGVDSAVAAARLLARGYRVVGVFIKVWHPDFMVCNWEAERLDAMRVAAHLGIPFLTCDAETEYRDEVANYFIEEYRSGRTPNPDVMCNQYVKFGAFLRFAKAKGADYIATGHYAVKRDSENGPELHRGVDNDKDQTYFLWSLTNEQLQYSLFPVGDTSKTDIRLEAAKLKLPTADKKDSQGVCFLGHVDIPEFLSHYIDFEPGDVLNTDGEVVGKHQGAMVYTIGQRHGFTLDTEDVARPGVYVVGKDIARNTITVSDQKLTLALTSNLTLHNVLLRQMINVGDVIDAQVRYRQTPFQATVTALAADTITLQANEIIEQPASGQSCVLYRGTLCLGGGVA